MDASQKKEKKVKKDKTERKGKKEKKEKKLKKEKKEKKEKKQERKRKATDQEIADIPDDTAAAPSRGKTQRRKKEAAEGERLWKEEGYDGASMRNVKWTPEEQQKIDDAITAYCEQNHLTLIELHDKINHETHNGRKGGLWNKLAGLCDLKRRSVMGIRAHILRTLEQKGRWTEDQLDKLRDLVIESPGRPKWKRIGLALGMGAEACRNKWKSALTAEGEKGKRGDLLTPGEAYYLRQGVVEVMNHLCPVDNINWPKVQKYLPHRPLDFLRQSWYHKILPKLLHYESKDGVPLDPNIFERLILRNIWKSDVEDIDDVVWANVNTFWPAYKNKEFVQKAWISLPKEMKLISHGGKVYTESDLPHFQDCIHELMIEYGCERHKKQDKRTLRHAKSVEEGNADKLSSDASDDDEIAESS